MFLSVCSIGVLTRFNPSIDFRFVVLSRSALVHCYSGDYVSNRVSDKLTKVHDRIYCARSGSAADTQAISDIVSYYLDIHAYVYPTDVSDPHSMPEPDPSALFWMLCACMWPYRSN
jgi:20S proteasome alpha/beta subunit